MTLNELINEVASLGFENQIEEDNLFITAANRALMTIFTERPVSRTVRIPISTHAPCSLIPIIKHTGDSDITIPLSGKYFSFRVSGVGEYDLNNGLWTESFKFNTKDSLFKGVAKADGASITFKGERYYTVYNLAEYNDVSNSGSLEAPEYSPYTEVKVDERYNDFLYFLGEPTTVDGAVKDAILDGGIIRLPRGMYDEIYITYARAPKKIVAGDYTAEIDVSAECVYLLPLLTAAYLWLDDEPDKAEYYMNLYRTEMNFIRRYNTVMKSTSYNDVVGWA